MYYYEYSEALTSVVEVSGRIFDLDRQTLISIGIQLLNACILAVLLTFILYKPVRTFMQKRADNIKTKLQQTDEAMAQANELKALYTEIEAERMEVLDAAHKLAARQNKQMLIQAKDDIAAMKERAAIALDAELERVDEEIRLHMIDVACVMAGKFVQDSIDKGSHDRLFDETITELRNVE